MTQAHRIAPTDLSRSGNKKEYSLRMAVREEDRLRCWHLVYQEYLAQGYAHRDDMEYRYSLHDALPGTGTFLVETAKQSVGTVTVFPDSPLGLPADDIYREELDGLRMQKRRPAEVGRLTICREHTNERSVLTSMFDALSIFSRSIRNATDLVITVNPSHAKFYERMLLFERVGEVKQLGSVCDAPAVLMRLDLNLQKQVIRWENGEGIKPAGKVERTFYRYFSSERQEKAWAARMRTRSSELDGAFVKRYFIQERPLIPNLPPSMRAYFYRLYPELNSSKHLVEQNTRVPFNTAYSVNTAH